MPEFTFNVVGEGVDLSSQPDPVAVSLTIVNNTGSESVRRHSDCD